MNNDTQLKVQAYLDNELSPGEARRLAGLISADAAARELYTELKDTKEILAHNEPEAKLSDSRDFYWSKIQRGIDSAERVPAPRASSPLWIRLLAPLAGSVALFAVLLSIVNPSTRVTPTASNTLFQRAVQHEVEDLNPDVSTITFRSETEGVTVVWVTSQ